MTARAVLLVIVAVGSPAFAETLRLDVDAAEAMALETSARVAAADARVGAAEAGIRAADADRLPTADWNANLGYRSSVPELAAPLAGPGQPPVVLFPDIQDTAATALRVRQSLYLGGAIDAGRAVARRQREGALADRQRTISGLRAELRSCYWRAVAAMAAVEASEAESVRAHRLLEDAHALLDAGMAVNAEVLAASARVAAAELRVVRARAAANEGLASLRSLIGVPADTELVLTECEAGGPLPPSPDTLEALVELALEQRPELDAIDARLAALEERARAVRGGLKPRVGAEAGWELARPNARYLPLADEWNDSWSVSVSAGWTLFDGARVRSTVAELGAERTALEADRSELVRGVRLEVEILRSHLVSALESVAAAELSWRAASARDKAEQERLAAGMATIADVLDAQSELAVAELEQVRAVAEARIAAAELERAVGR